MTQHETNSGPARPDDRSGILMDLLVALLAPMFLSFSGGDIRVARMAAAGTVNGYRARNQSDLIAIAQIIAFGLAALCALSRSMEDDVSAPMMLSLCRTANALNRSAEQNRRSIKPDRCDSTPVDPAPPSAEATAAGSDLPPDAELFMTAVAARQLAAEADARLQDGAPSAEGDAASTESVVTEKRHKAMWAVAMVAEASELTASIPSLPLAERQTALIRAGALNSTAHELLTGVPSMPRTPPRPARN